MSFRIEHRIGIAAPASVIWGVVSDLPRWSEWNPIYPVIEGRVAIGAPVSFELHLPNRPPRTFTGTVVDWVPESQLIWSLKLLGGLVRTTRYIEIETLGERNCILANGEIFDGAGAGLMPKAERALIRRAFELVNEAAKARVQDMTTERRSVIDDLYSARLLALAANLPHAGRLPPALVQGTSERIAKLCGSRVVVDVALDARGRVAAFAQDVQACALGQASAGVLGSAILGATAAEVDAARDALGAMLKSGGAPPSGRFADLGLLQAVKDFPARHASTLLAFEAAAEAIDRASRAAPSRTPAAAVG